MCERKPSQSLDARTEAESSLPLSELSHSNIRLWNDLFTASSSLESAIHTPPPESAPPVPTESPASTSASDSGSDMGNHPEIDIIKLRVFNIWVNSQTEMPQELREHVKDICSSPRLKSSPAGKNLSRKQQMAQSKKEWTAIDILQDDLLFKTEAEGDEAKIVRLSEACLERVYNPPTSVFEGAASLPQAICDTAICYITPEDANTNLSKPALTFGEEIMVYQDAVTSGGHFPFLTCQWKSHVGAEGHSVARNQGARDGAAIVNYLRDFYESAGQIPSVVDTCHWSLTCDILTVILWLHWAVFDPATGTMKHHMRQIDHQPLNTADDPNNGPMEKFRQQLRAILSFSIGPRLQKLKAAIPLVHANKAQKSRRTAKSTAASEDVDPANSSKRRKI